jgi:ADP-heptose:LPS heptosyltransferase
MRILVAQMTRMGDVLQTSTLVRGLRIRHPDAHITAMVRRLGKTIAERNPDINDVIVYDEDAMYLDLRSDDSDRLLRAYEQAVAYVETIRDGNFDVIHNCTHSLASAMLFKLAGASDVVGAHLSDDWQFVIRGRGPNYFFTSVLHREYNDLNLCDLFRHFIKDAPPCRQLVFEVHDEDREAARSILAEHGIGPDDFVACLQLGASDDYKRWPESHFAALAQLLQERRQAGIVLVGVKEEAKLGKVFESHAPGMAVHLFGKTSVPELAALLERANVLVTNDTGTMHIAAAVKCPVVLVSVGYVHFRETGPYGDGHCAIEARRASVGRSDTMKHTADERSAVQPAQVLRAVDLILGREPNGAIPSLEESSALKDVDIHMSRFLTDGCVAWNPVIRRPMSERDYIRIAYRAMWLEFLNAKQDKRAETESIAATLACFAPSPGGVIYAWHKALCEAFEHMAKLAQRGARTTEQVLDLLQKKGGIARAKERVAEMMQLDEETRVFGEVHPALRPLVAAARFERDNLEGADPVKLAQTTLQIYRDLYARARLTSQKLARVAELASGTGQ